ncbi:hypothetical protein GF380_01045 [Candidatus Uhrbacteria bacterium]|nr:hypothetical protein [Candidatus Uhrbacteria bacterium]MBD3283907.1 hypothetical protein [Candidatus Uhrbacteria bacterium]
MLYLVDLALLKRLTIAGGVSCLILLFYIRQAYALYFFCGFMSAFTICWVAITISAKKHRSSEEQTPKTHDAE